ncbi:MAG: protein arginine kinase [Gracilibacteraceae bacterium]|jgi:protein arginine kinase|nr:protein arginine kinase [Gracilibacteraceae bacterium]
MNVAEVLARRSHWLTEQGRNVIVLSTRVRLARNLADRPFPSALSPEMTEQTEKEIAAALEAAETEGQRLRYLPLKDMSDMEKTALVEKHLISPALAALGAGRGVALSPDHRLAVMVNEEDHIRLQVILPDSRLQEAFQVADQLDDALEDKLDFAFRERCGYLTACPTNVGTGMRVSTMMHLPALVMTKQMQQVLNALSPLGLAIRGLYGEGSKAWGNIFQISNQVTLGKSEEDTLVNIEAVTEQICELENHARQMMLAGHSTLEDKVWRARGLLQNARIMPVEEAFRLVSEDRLGVDTGFLPPLRESFASLLLNLLPAGLRYRGGTELTDEQLNEARAAYLRQATLGISTGTE